MTLSRYERRVLEEFEVEFKTTGPHARRGRTIRRLRYAWVHAAAALRRRRTALCCALVGVSICVVVIGFAPPVAAAVSTGLVGLATGVIAATTWRRGAPPRAR